MKFVALLCMLLLGSSIAFSQSISGNMNSESHNEALRYGNVDIYKGDKLVASVLTDKLGNFAIALDTGTYVCVMNYAGFTPITKEIKVTGNEVADFKMKEDPKAKKPTTKADDGDLDLRKEMREIEEVAIVSSKSDKKGVALRKSRTDAYDASPTISSGRVMSTHSGDLEFEGLSTNTASSKLLTAGEINDFSKWKMWQDLSKGELSAYQKMWQIAPSGRYTVMLQSEDGIPIVDAVVQLLLNRDVLFTTRSDNTGKAECWLTIKNETPVLNGKLSIQISTNGKTVTINKVTAFDKGLNHQKLKISCQEVENVDVAFVVDATGSMGDEINFLKAEMNDVIFESRKISNKLNFRFANVFYRDMTDSYITKSMNFNRILTESTAFIDEQNAGGGGDFPEAMDVGLDSAINNLSWSEHARARILFLILDAPPHQSPQVNERLQKLILQAAEKGIRIVPIGASGIDKSTEYLMRALALGTNGTYTFLTDHSGIGNSHIKPSTDSYEVETLNALLVRIVKSYTYMTDCQQQIPDLALNIPDSIVSNVPIKDSSDTSASDPKALHITWSYYPNPTNGIVNILPNADIKELYISDLSGKVLQVLPKLSKNERIQVDLSAYPTGIYLIRYLDENNHWLSGKVVLQRTS
ncbi:T9SS type A sorting domain-containing protein [Fluviicola taffensis]|uniref:von Willebrand factor type A n=1 Tax=Fluviicola taffensis (strain DSM 16823 / NCIMB 13979 / RW262) TaxID=755732 RepID=F2IDD9_FLUTR|nr:T9SS type A sorting domain-containing protein [Fluviicola taffensis]AEA42315.1 von Willebrand factor type A [Fluviicola taffensis DSM 16823]